MLQRIKEGPNVKRAAISIRQGAEAVTGPDSRSFFQFTGF